MCARNVIWSSVKTEVIHIKLLCALLLYNRMKTSFIHHENLLCIVCGCGLSINSFENISGEKVDGKLDVNKT